MRYDINLIKKKDASVLDKTLYFFLNYLRYILVITQLVVIAVLFYRFRIDQNIIDLKDTVDQQKEIVQVVQPLLAEAKKIDQQTTSAKSILKKQGAFIKSVEYALSIFPQGLILDRLTIEEGSLKLSGIALIPTQLQQFYRKLQKDGRFAIVELDNIKRDERGYTFILNLEGYRN